MTPDQIDIQLIAAVVAAACALPGSFLVLRKMAMMSDAISHAILPGIVIGFFLTNDLNSPLLIVAAAATGVLTVFLVELLMSTRLVKEDAAIGIVFPVLFSVGVILIARFAGDVHLDTDAVLLGELAFAPFDRLVVMGTDLGPRSLFVMGGVGVLNALFIALFYKELKVATFDAGLAAALGFAPAAIHYGLMTLVSVTAVAAFDAVGSILVVALMIGPPAAAYLLTDRLERMILISVALGLAAAISGFWVAHFLDASIAGAMAGMVGVEFGVVYLLAPRHGILAGVRRRLNQKWEFAEKLLAIHLFQHERLPEARTENRVDHLEEHLNWPPDFALRVVRRAEEDGLIRGEDGFLELTERGRDLATEAIVQT
ncbi:MAG: metal ABC transporter permease [Rhodothermales bacterium]